MSAAPAAVDLQQVLGRGGDLLSPGRWNKPEVRRVAMPQGDVILKDWRIMAGWLRPLARHLARREAGIYGLLDHLSQVPRVLARGDRVLVLEIVPGRPIWQMNGHPQARAAATTLEQIVDVMHAAGVYHFDLRKRDNILVTDAGEVYIIDFTTAVAPRRYGPLGWLLRPIAALVDHYALLKWKDLLCPEELTPRESRLLHLLNHTRPGRHRRSR